MEIFILLALAKIIGWIDFSWRMIIIASIIIAVIRKK
jgi:hypothetical protein